MFTQCELKRLVLECVKRLGTATSRDVAAQLKISLENASMTLGRCKRQGLVGRREFRRGRVRGYVYWLLDRGKNRLLYYLKHVKMRPTLGVVDINRLVQDARNEMAPLYAVACTAFDGEGLQCSGKWQDMRRSYLFLKKGRMVSAFASERMLNIWFPEVSEAIREASEEMTIQDLVEFSSIMRSFSSQSNSFTIPMNPVVLLAYRRFNRLLIKRIDELHHGQFYFYQEWQKEKERGDSLERRANQRKEAEKKPVDVKGPSLSSAQVSSDTSSLQQIHVKPILETERLCQEPPVRTTPTANSMKDHVDPQSRKPDTQVESVTAHVLPIVAFTLGAALFLFIGLYNLYGPDVRTVLLEYIGVVRAFADCL